ncbi:hypothetical protein [Marinobacter daepoensis]|uniref:hypothetical protein n=1 Tax=Marinobacter daepoensis TaxID=262077 RepID=UPI00040CEBA9|nr:hypothetical protein [Marinobacter daepoensis]
MKHRWLSVALILALMVVVSLWLWTREQLAFAPEAGSERTFVIETRMELQRTGDRYRRRADVLETSVVASSRVVSNQGGVVTLATQARQFRVQSDGELIDSRLPDTVAERHAQFLALLKAGSEQQISRQGQLLDWAFEDQATAETLEDQMPAVFLQRVAAMGTLTLFQPMFPADTLELGLTWEAPAVTVNELALPQRRYEVTALGDDRLTVRISELDEEGEASPLGYLILERATGWPLKARLRVTRTARLDGREYDEVAYINVRQPGEPPTLSRAQLEQMAYMHREFIPFDPDWPDSLEHLKPIPVLSELEVAEGRERLNQSLLWFPPEQGHSGKGMDLAFMDLIESGLLPQELRKVEALDEQGVPVDPALVMDHGFNLANALWNADEFQPVRHPFDPMQLTPEALSRVHELALEADVWLPDQAVTLELRRADQQAGVVAGQGYQVRDIQWSDDQVRFQVRREDGRPMGMAMRLGAIPAAGDEMPGPFASRVTLAALAPLAEQLTEGSHEDFVQTARAELYPLPDEDIWRSYQVDLRMPGPVGVVSVYIQPYNIRTLNLQALNAAGTLTGGPVAGTRLLDDYRMPEFDFPALDMQAFNVSGADHNQLDVEVPPDSGARCSAEVASPGEYNGSPWSLEQGWMSFSSSLELMTENGQRFFYDAQVTLKLQCVTGIEVQTEQVDESRRVRRVDAHTIELSDALFEELKAIREYQSSSIGNRLPVVGRNQAGDALEMLSGLYEYRGGDAGDSGNPKRIKFWGEVVSITYPQVTGVESKNVTVEFPPLP